MHLVSSDLSWLRDSLPTVYESMPDPKTEFPSSLKYVLDNFSSWKTVLARARKIMVTLSSRAETVAGPVALSLPDQFSCTHCVLTFPTAVQLQSHCAKMHGYRNPLWYRLHNTVCSHCSTDFHSRDRLYRHVYRVASCHMFYLSDVAPMTSDQLAAIDAAQKLKKKDIKAILIPPVKVPSP